MHKEMRKVHVTGKRARARPHTHTHTHTHTRTHTHIVAMKRLFALCPSVSPFIGAAATGWIYLKFSIRRASSIKIYLETPKLIGTGQKYRALYVKTQLWRIFA